MVSNERFLFVVSDSHMLSSFPLSNERVVCVFLQKNEILLIFGQKFGLFQQITQEIIELQTWDEQASFVDIESVLGFNFLQEIDRVMTIFLQPGTIFYHHHHIMVMIRNVRILKLLISS